MARKTLFRNESSEVIPPYSVIRITGSDELSDGTFIWTADKPDDQNKIIRVNGPFEVETYEYGECSPLQGPVWCSFNNSETPNFGDDWGPVEDSWKLTESGSGVTIAGSVSGQIVKVNTEGSGGGCDPQNEIQFIHMIGPPTGGEFTLNVINEVLLSLPYNITSNSLQTEIISTPSFSDGDIEVLGEFPGAMSIEFKGDYENQKVQIMTSQTSSLLGVGVGIIIIANQRGIDG